MWIMTPTIRGAEEEVESLTIQGPFIDPIALSCETSSEAMRYSGVKKLVPACIGRLHRVPLMDHGRTGDW